MKDDYEYSCPTLEEISRVLGLMEPGGKLEKFRDTAIYHSFMFQRNLMLAQTEEAS